MANHSFLSHAVGKRLPSLSDTTHKSLGDLGVTAATVERALEEKFHLAQVWDCVLLLDEADVFLAERSRDDIKRNALVSG